MGVHLWATVFRTAGAAMVAAALAVFPTSAVATVERASMTTALTDDAEAIIGTEGDDIITNVGSGDVVESLGGNDKIYFVENEADGDGVENATVRSGAGDDLVVLYHRNFGNAINTGSGNDEVTMATRNHSNVIETEQGDDIVRNGEEFSGHTIATGPGDDLVTGNNGEGGIAYVDAGAGDDEVLLGRITGTFLGGPGRDRIEFGLTVGGAYVDAGTGDDTIVPGADGGGHTILAGRGDDVVELSASNFNTVGLGPGDDSVTGGSHPGDFSRGNAIDGDMGFDAAVFGPDMDPPNTCVNVEQATNC
jgi:hypothetical protein